MLIKDKKSLKEIYFYFYLYIAKSFTAHVLKICRTPGPQRAKDTKFRKVCLKTCRYIGEKSITFRKNASR